MGLQKSWLLSHKNMPEEFNKILTYKKGQKSMKITFSVCIYGT